MFAARMRLTGGDCGVEVSFARSAYVPRLIHLRRRKWVFVCSRNIIDVASNITGTMSSTLSYL